MKIYSKYKGPTRLLTLWGMLLFLFSSPLSAAFEDLGGSARVVGMGNAFVGLADDSRALYYNPAGLGYFLKSDELIMDYSRLFVGLDDNSTLTMSFISFAHPFRKIKLEQSQLIISTRTAYSLNLSSSFLDLSLSSQTAPSPTEELTITQVETLRDVHHGSLALAYRTFSLQDAYKEETIYLSYGRRFRDRFALGLSIKILNESFTQDEYTQIDPVFDFGNRDSVRSFSADVGFLYNIFPRGYLGLSVWDVNEPNIGLKDSVKIPRTMKFGFGYKRKFLSAAIDLTRQNERLRLNTGFERWLFNRAMALRAGMGFGQRNLFNVMTGMSFNMEPVQIDYAFQIPLSGLKGTGGTHRISFTYRFGRSSSNEVESGSLEMAYIELQKEAEYLLLQLDQSKDEKEELKKVLIEEASRRIRERIEVVRERSAPKRKRSRQGETKEKTVKRRTVTVRTHTVRSGENLRDIAVLYYGNPKKWSEIYNANKGAVGRGGSVRAGQVLIIPKTNIRKMGFTSPSLSASPQRLLRRSAPPAHKQILKASPASPANEILTPSSPAGKRTHVVKEGESLQSIALQYYGSPRHWKKIIEANPGKVSRGTVEPGQKLIIPR